MRCFLFSFILCKNLGVKTAVSGFTGPVTIFLFPVFVRQEANRQLNVYLTDLRVVLLYLYNFLKIIMCLSSYYLINLTVLINLSTNHFRPIF